MAQLSRWLSSFSTSHIKVPQPREDKSCRFGLFRFRSPLLTESLRFLFLLLLRCFTSEGSLLIPYVFRYGYRLRGGFSHSEISGSKAVCASPKLIAACRVLHRQVSPRHPSIAFKCFNSIIRRPFDISKTPSSNSWLNLQICFPFLFVKNGKEQKVFGVLPSSSEPYVSSLLLPHPAPPWWSRRDLNLR